MFIDLGGQCWGQQEVLWAQKGSLRPEDLKMLEDSAIMVLCVLIELYRKFV